MTNASCENVLRKRSRGWAYTVFNYTADELAGLASRIADYHVYAEEVCPTTGRSHIQGYIYFKDAKAGSACIKYIGIDGVHIEPQGKYSSPQANREYIIGPYQKGDKSKPFNPNAVEIGQVPVKGARNDLESFRDAIKNGMTRREAYDDYVHMMASYPKMYNDLRSFYLEDKAWAMYEAGEKPEINVICGPTAVGKTRGVFEKYKRNVYKLEMGDGSNGSTFWNGYDGQDIILIDDFYGQLKLDYLLRILDRYPQQFNTKGGFTWRVATKIFITSNEKPENWYKGVQNKDVKAALYRRFDNVIDMFPKIDIVDISTDDINVSLIENKPAQIRKDVASALEIRKEKRIHVERVPTLDQSTRDTYDNIYEELRQVCMIGEPG